MWSIISFLSFNRNDKLIRVLGLKNIPFRLLGPSSPNSMSQTQTYKCLLKARIVWTVPPRIVVHLSPTPRIPSHILQLLQSRKGCTPTYLICPTIKGWLIDTWRILEFYFLFYSHSSAWNILHNSHFPFPLFSHSQDSHDCFLRP